MKTDKNNKKVSKRRKRRLGYDTEFGMPTQATCGYYALENKIGEYKTRDLWVLIRVQVLNSPSAYVVQTSIEIPDRRSTS